MFGLMQDRQLLLSTLIEHAAANHADTELVSRLADSSIYRSTYLETSDRAKRLANALIAHGVQRGDCIATLAWNTHRHFELYYGVSGIGAVCHTVNPRLFPDQIKYIVQHAEDKVLFFDLNLLNLAEKVAAACPGIKSFIALCDASELPDAHKLPNLTAYESFIGAASDVLSWPQFDEKTACALCYTSGTTGNPKGVLYSHRALVLHSYAGGQPDNFNLSSRDVIMPVSSMYHANAWGVPYVATQCGAKLVFPGSALDPESLVDLMEAEQVTMSLGVPTVWLGVSQYLEKTGRRLTALKNIAIGGSSCPLSLMTYFRDKQNCDVLHVWGMTETSPLGALNRPKAKHANLPASGRDDIRAKQGRVAYGVEMKIQDDEGKELPRDGISFGHLMIRGWWIASAYFKTDKPALDADGWFHTGDVATLDADGYMRITDRSKDVIKSGGEWISSIDLENAAVGHPAVSEAAVIGAAHPKWDERPILLLTLKQEASITREEMLDFLRDKVAKWWLPDDVVTVTEIPHTATGKILKTKLREEFRDHFVKAEAAE
jgi:3-(methylthio)propionyl---CoA ligase